MAESHYSRKLRKRIIDSIMTTENSLGLGNAADYPKYREQVGIIEGLRIVLGICDELDKEEA